MPNSAQAEFAGFGLRRLERNGFLCAKAGHSDQRFGIEILMLCANALCQNSRIRHSPNSGTVRRNFMAPEFYGDIFFCFGKARETTLLKKRQNLLLKSSQTSRERRFGIEITLSCANALCQNLRIRRSRILRIVCRFPVLPTPCAKTAKSATFCDCLPVSALECFSAYGTGIFFPNSAPLNSGLWLGAFGKVWLFRCQSGIRGLWLTAFDKSGFFRCQSRLCDRVLQKKTAFFSAKAQSSGAVLWRFFQGDCRYKSSPLIRSYFLPEKSKPAEQTKPTLLGVISGICFICSSSFLHWCSVIGFLKNLAS